MATTPNMAQLFSRIRCVAAAITISTRMTAVLAAAWHFAERLKASLFVIHGGAPEAEFHDAMFQLEMPRETHIVWSEGEPAGTIVAAAEKEDVGLLIAVARPLAKASWRASSARWMSCAAVAAALWLASGYAKDVSGSNDHPALSRIAGSTIAMYERKDQAEIRIPLERVIFDLQTQKFNAFKTISASGRLTRILYALPAGNTPQDAKGYYENALRQANGQVLFSGAQDQLDNGNDRFVNQVYYGNLQDRIYNLLLLNRENAYVAGKLNWNGRDLYVQVYTFANQEGRRTNLVKKGRVGALVDIVEVGPAYPPTALVTSEQMASEINRTGRIALYGLYFDTNRTEIKPESKPTLEQIADLLKREPSLKLLVVGHTDNVGDFESNRDLSQRRAESVANALVTGFGIAPDRLVPFGVSYAAPVASNATAEGRSQNRRVELVRY